jgi:CheY-like chemotaxis protein
MKTVLVLEDEAPIALDLKQNLIAIGVGDVFVSSSVDQALAILSGFPIDFAIIDFNLGIETAEAAVEYLETHHIPFVVLNSYPAPDCLSEGMPSWPLLSKPASMPALRDALSAAGRGGQLST